MWAIKEACSGLVGSLFSRFSGRFVFFPSMPAFLPPRACPPLLAACLAVAVAAPPVLAAAPQGFRPLAPGVLTVIPADAGVDDTVQRVDLPEITVARADMAWQPKRAPASTTMVERAKSRDAKLDIWCLEFAFKPPRRIDVEVPVLDAESNAVKMRITPCWYLIYRVKNVGWRRTVIDAEDPTKRSLETFEKPIRFMPHFVLESREGLSAEEGPTAYRGYLDRIVPTALEPIRQREDPARRLFDSVSIAERELAPGEERWGVAVWENIDPRIDFFSISVQGLTNATRWRPTPAGRRRAGGDETEETLESLRLDFWRPGDAVDRSEDEMTIGYAGIFERMTLGALLNEALDRPALTKSDPVAGLALVKLGAGDLMEPEDGAAGRFAPVEKLLVALAKLPAGAERAAAARAVLGDLGVVALEELSQAVATQSEGKPLEFLAALVRELAPLPAADRRRQAVEILGAAAPKLETLVKETVIARRTAVLDAAGLTRTTVPRSGPLAAFDTLRDAVLKAGDAASGERLLAGLFGADGPALYRAATAVHEGIDHAWVFRYEIDVPPEENRR